MAAIGGRGFGAQRRRVRLAGGAVMGRLVVRPAPYNCGAISRRATGPRRLFMFHGRARISDRGACRQIATSLFSLSFGCVLRGWWRQCPFAVGLFWVGEECVDAVADVAALGVAVFPDVGVDP